MKILIFLAAWRRPEITEICFMGIDRLRKSGLYPIDTMCVISEKSMIPLCKKYNIDFVIHKNEPLGEKKNVGLNYAMLKSWDHLLEIGSDDILKTEILEAYRPYFEKGVELFGIKDLVFMNSENGECRRYKTNTVFGAGRVMKRSTIEQIAYGVDIIAKEGIICVGGTTGEGMPGFLKYDQAKELEGLGRVEITGQPRYKIWKDDIMKGLDNSSTFLFHKNLIGHKAVDTKEPLVIDIKSETNIWKFESEVGERYSLEKVMEGLSEDEKSALAILMKESHKKGIEKAVLR